MVTAEAPGSVTTFTPVALVKGWITHCVMAFSPTPP